MPDHYLARNWLDYLGSLAWCRDEMAVLRAARLSVRLYVEPIALGVIAQEVPDLPVQLRVMHFRPGVQFNEQ